MASAGLALTTTFTATAADFPYDAQVPTYAPPAQLVTHTEPFGGWYIRGDVGYRQPQWNGANYITYGPPPGTGTFDSGSLRGAMSLGGGLGYQVTRYLRTDFTVDWWARSQFRGSTSGFCAGGVPCSSSDTASFGALVMLANAYADLGTYNRITPYVGAGIGGAHVKWGDLTNNLPDGTWIHKGASGMRFAWALMAGASYCLGSNLHADLGYRFTRISGGRMFEEFSPNGASIGAGPGFDRAFNTHEVRAGLRYQFGGANESCDEPQAAPAFHQATLPTWPTVYK